MDGLLPEFHCTEDAVRFGSYMSRDQYVLLHGARQALQREFNELRGAIGWHVAEHRNQLAVKIQLLGEAIDEARVIAIPVFSGRASTFQPFSDSTDDGRLATLVSSV